MKIILDISANTHQNDEKYYRRMIETIGKIGLHKHEIIIKGQLFTVAGENVPQDLALFERMARWTWRNFGIKTTASVFDKVSLILLLLMDIPYELPFIKIANNRELDWLIGEIPRKIPVYKSVSPEEYWGGDICDGALRWEGSKLLHLLCVSKYPADEADYGVGPGGTTAYALSDHTIGLELVKDHEPVVYECHFVLQHDPNNLDGGEWAKTPLQLKELIKCT